MAFHIHVPKPLHGWKAFLNEIMVIVIGVLIALGLEAIVEELHWQHKVTEGRDRLRAELLAMYGNAAEQVTVTPCILAQLDRLRDHLSSDQADLPPLAVDKQPHNSAVLRLPTRNVSSSTWTALQQDGTTSHFPVKEQRQLGSAYTSLDVIRDLMAESGSAAGKLLATANPRPLPAQARSDLLLVVSDEYRRIEQIGRISGQVMAILRDAGYQPSDEAVAKRLNYLSHSNTSDTIGYCKARGLPLDDWKQRLAEESPLQHKAFSN